MSIFESILIELFGALAFPGGALAIGIVVVALLYGGFLVFNLIVWAVSSIGEYFKGDRA